MDSIGREALFNEIKALLKNQIDSELSEVCEFLTLWIGDGQLQTFESREQFRKEAQELLNAILENNE